MEEDVTKKPNTLDKKIEGNIRTYATDIAETMRREKGSIIKIALAEQQRRNEFKEKINPVATKNLIVMMLGFVLIVGGIMIFIYSIFNQTRTETVTRTNVVYPSLLFTENQVQIDISELNRAEFLRAIHTQTDNQTLIPETMNNIYVSYKTSFGQTSAPSTLFITKAGIEIPETLFQNLDSQFMLGVYSKPPTNNQFLIFKIKDFNETFLAMRDFETNMLSNMLRFFRIDTKKDGKDIFSKQFETATLFNKEARVLKNSDGKIILSYIFLDSKTIMITTDTIAVQEVLKRLNLQTLK
jgi:hypothetical protein